MSIILSIIVRVEGSAVNFAERGDQRGALVALFAGELERLLDLNEHLYFWRLYFLGEKRSVSYLSLALRRIQPGVETDAIVHQGEEGVDTVPVVHQVAVHLLVVYAVWLCLPKRSLAPDFGYGGLGDASLFRQNEDSELGLQLFQLHFLVQLKIAIDPSHAPIQ